MLASDHSAFSTPLPMTQAVLLVLLGLAAFGCTPKIGDSCTVSTNCSASGDRLCDITEPGGYCTIFNCEPDGCPADSACINFGTELSSVNLCQSSQGNSPYQRSFCMATCSVDGDCRGGYQCIDLSGTMANVYGAVLADNSGNGKVCAVAPAKGMMAIPAGPTSNEVCLGSDAGVPVSAAVGDGGASGDAGAGGASGASNDTGAGG
jgi:hypothetical protein